MATPGDGGAPPASSATGGSTPGAPPVASQSALPTPPQLQSPATPVTGSSVVGGLGSSLPAGAPMATQPQQQSFTTMNLQQQSALMYPQQQQKVQQQMRNPQRLIVPPQAPRGPAVAGVRASAVSQGVYPQQQQQQGVGVASSSSPMTGSATSMQQQLAQRIQQQQQRPQQILIPTQQQQGGNQQQQQMQQQGGGAQAQMRSSVYPGQPSVNNMQYMQRAMPQPQGVHPSMQSPSLQARQKQAQASYQPAATMQNLQMMSNLRPVPGMLPGAQRAQANLRPQQQQQQPVQQQIQQQQQLVAPQRMPGTPMPRGTPPGYQLQSPVQQQWANKQQQQFPGQYQARPVLTPQQQTFLQQQHLRAKYAGVQRPPVMSPNAPGTPAAAAAGIPPTEPTNRILGKRSIQELVAQVDAREKLEPEVEDALLEIADDFIETVTTFACALAKHRKSTVLEAKDVLLHLERNWHITLPGFGGDEYKTYKKPVPSEPHKQRLAVVKKSLATPDLRASKLQQQQQQAAPPLQSPGPRLGS